MANCNSEHSSIGSFICFVSLSLSQSIYSVISVQVSTYVGRMRDVACPLVRCVLNELRASAWPSSKAAISINGEIEAEPLERKGEKEEEATSKASFAVSFLIAASIWTGNGRADISEDVRLVKSLPCVMWLAVVQ